MVKFGTEQGTFGPLLRAKFHPHRWNVSPLRGEKPQNWPLSKLNTGRFAFRAMLPVKMPKKCRSTGTVHTSAKARLTSIAIRIRIRIWIHIGIRDPDRHQNLIICSLAHRQPFLKISCKFVRKFLRKVANRQTDKQRRKHNLLGGGNKSTTETRKAVVGTNRRQTDVRCHAVIIA